MNSYDDMQRFKDKAQIKDMNFRDMSGQVLQSDTVVWPIMKQLLRNQASDDSLSGAQPVSIAQPVPANLHDLSAPVPSASRRVTPTSALVSGSSEDTPPALFNAVAASLPPVEAVPAPVAAAAIDVAPEAARPHPLASAPVMGGTQVASEAGRFRQLFTRHRPDEIHSAPKSMLLKPLLEKIALCR
ncbi:cellulose biosynthesis protein BcsO [Dickeya chrysanthemi]|uniref:cellulose biosynthesis protein BcsO n=1 Tax=Dickeya chrysanthemi TaxID=556 RepID=UPI001CF46AF7|nr:cellulose biosynthesis protein BcsO [Dickeya chrysanthemi]MCA7008963.1 cellulose biosynthesis protein BcsO [Dickeya chrysanthemi]